MISALGVAKQFGRKVALADVSFEVTARRALLVGRNGAGKTTLLRILAGYIDADAGVVRIGGGGSGGEARRLGYLPEGSPLPGELGVAAYLGFRAALKLPRGERGARVDAVCTSLALDEVRRQPIATLSRGFRQRVGLADALLAAPEVLILDEPTAGLDPLQVRQLADLLDTVAAATTILVATHSLGDAIASAAQQVVVLAGGRVVGSGATSQLLADAGVATLEEAVVELTTKRAP